ncbi:copper resistance CopC family protein [Cellulomonas sp. 179-A 4D5 NHS]|uniref:copper resistance CopC family protein n=1 Tax=Cellulomonas sp. 179-A 4D5 NHS TaxID=3142378 RepID=UPI0039A2C98A
MRSPQGLVAHSPQPTHRTLALSLTSVAALLVAVVLAAAPAAAHTGLVSSNPAAGAALTEVPATVTLTFSQEISEQFATAALSVDGATGSEVPLTVQGAQAVLDTTAVPDLPVTPGQANAWQVLYRVVSPDGHPISGTVDFTVTPPAPPTPVTTEPTSPTTAPSPETTTPAAIAAPGDPAADGAGTMRGGGALALVGLLAVVGAGAVVAARSRRTPPA